jgi:hypothetical protein
MSWLHGGYYGIVDLAKDNGGDKRLTTLFRPPF